jgi:hypothetical protein
MKKLPNLLVAAVVGLGALACGTVLAHGSDAKHGGVVQTAGDLAFELVGQGDMVTIYIEDHGKPLATTGIKGKLTVLNGDAKSEAELSPAGDNKLQATGVKVAPGAKAVAALTLPSQKVVTARFTVK